MPSPTRLRLAVFDLDGTLKQAVDPYIYLHTHLGTLEACHAYTQAGFEGRISFEEWLALDAGLWKGVSVDRVQALFRANPYLPGVNETIAALRAAGVRLAMVSSGLTIHTDQVRDELGFDFAAANEVLATAGVLDGRSVVHVPEGGKGKVVEDLFARYQVRADEAMAVGDSNSDADMFARVGLGVAVNPASQRVRDAAGIVLEEADLTPLIPMLRARGFLE